MHLCILNPINEIWVYLRRICIYDSHSEIKIRIISFSVPHRFAGESLVNGTFVKVAHGSVYFPLLLCILHRLRPISHSRAQMDSVSCKISLCVCKMSPKNVFIRSENYARSDNMKALPF